MTRRDSAVLVPVYRDADGALRVVLVVRGPGGIHGGQLAFPGGLREPTDATARETALREAFEEIGLEASRVTVLAELPPMDTRTSNFRITPILARIERPAEWRVAPREVAEVIEPRLDDLARPDMRGESVERFPTWPAPRKIAFIRIGEHRLWGATYRILEPLLPRLVAGEWPI